VAVNGEEERLHQAVPRPVARMSGPVTCPSGGGREPGVLLASDEASFMTGTLLPVDDGPSAA